MTQRQHQHTLADLSRYLLVVEPQITAKQWEEIDYQRVPSRANLQYNSAFLRHDEDRRRAFLGAVEKGEAKINASVLFRMTSYIGTVMPTAPTPIWKCCGRTSPIRCRAVVTPSWWPTVLVV